MPPPVILSEIKADISTIVRPEWIDIEKIPSGVDFITYIHYQPIYDMVIHTMESVKEKLEVMGFLIGRVYRIAEGMTIVEVEKTITSKLDATAVSVRFASEGIQKAVEMLDDLDEDQMIVGWYHSHPGYTCFLSSTDISTQYEMFPKPYHIAILIDPVYDDIKVFSVVDGDTIERWMMIDHGDELVVGK